MVRTVMARVVGVVVAVAASPLVAAQESGSAGCPCVEFHGLSKFLTEDRKGIEVKPGGDQGQSYVYPSSYGNSVCTAWDAELEPYCVGEGGEKKAYSPAWCAAKWCYVSKDNCDLAMVFESAYFKGEGVYYSYTTCGAKNSFSNWEETGGADSQLDSMLELVGDYTKATRDGIQQALKAGNVDSSQCGVMDACSCGVCKSNVDWKQNIYFGATSGFAKSDAEFKCLAGIMSDTYIRVANLEYNNAKRIGYQYFGYQSDGSYLQWPAVSWCPDKFDPRFRDWYASTASGPKDVVIVIDTSGSMQKEDRMRYAKEAATMVLGTLTWVDFASVVGFNSDISMSNNKLVPVKGQYKKDMASFIAGMSPGGSTNYKDALQKAMGILRDSRGDMCTSAGCNKALLFLTDGEPDEWADGDYAMVKGLNDNNEVRLFTYGLGAGASMDIIEKLARDNGGTSIKVTDGNKLADAMASYYEVFADPSIYESIYDRLTWVEYEDALTKTQLLAGCMPVYDRRGQPKLLGVSCMDLNMVVDMGTLRKQSGFKDFQVKYEADARKCLAAGKQAPSAGKQVTMEACGSGWNQSMAAGKESQGIAADSAVVGARGMNGGALLALLSVASLLLVRH